MVESVMIPGRRVRRALWRHFLIVHGTAMLGTICALVMLPFYWHGWVEPVTLLLMWFVTANLGISIGFHRLFTHRSFEATSTLKSILGVAGCMAGQGPLIYWVALHRRHHRHSDGTKDPHSPRAVHPGLGNQLRSLWHAHLGWVFEHDVPATRRYAVDLQKDPLVRRISDLYPLWMIVGLALPAAVGWIMTGNLKGAVLGLMWGGFVRLVIVNHTIWSVNSICHAYGSKCYAIDDDSRNNAVIAMFTFGEGWHNNHHARPTSPTFSAQWWQPDVGYWTIRFFQLLRLARPTQNSQDATTPPIAAV